MENYGTCPVCGAKAYIQQSMDPVKFFYSCPICGRYEYYVRLTELEKFNLNHLSSYLLYNGFKESMNEYRYFTTMSKERCDEYNIKFRHGDVTYGHPVRLENENVENWYPKTFSEKVDNILLYLNSRIMHMGEYVKLSKEEMISCFFVDRYDYKDGNCAKRTDTEIQAQQNYILNFLVSRNYILSPQSWAGGENERPVTLSPEGYDRIDSIQKNMVDGKKVLVAMKFGEDTQKLREMIRQGITLAGYVAIFIDEVEHNDFITPELLKYIKDSKFIVADLSHQNNGAYSEEGYAMGLGKPVIQLCKKDVKLHFDIAQKNTIIWKTEEEIPERLKNRIIATID
ncbi:hypothetical protein WMO41_13225 [Ventrimonas sp. CLA-AP-H27]|uniref:Uncharacterized protein n=1 Tax=Ventrimonas faecis TaxID=3133170 RepID=A0ABV1HP69_9FIRM